MKAILLYFLLLIPVISEAGLFGSIVGGYVGGTVSGKGKGNTCQPVEIKNIEVQTRAKKVNDALWEMHKSGVYDDDYKIYLKYLEASDEFKETIKVPDTVAWIYFDFKEYKKALKVYESNVIPWVKFEKLEDQEKYEEYYALFKEAESCFFNCDSIIVRAKEERQGKGNLKNYEVTTKKEKAIQVLRKSEEGLKKLGGKIKDKAKDIADKQKDK